MTAIPDKFNTLQEVADFLKTMDNSKDAQTGFDMLCSHPSQTTRHPCGSACCIGGWINYVNGTHYSLAHAVQQLTTKVDKGVQYEEAHELCFMKRGVADMGLPDRIEAIENRMVSVTPQQAARAIEILLETGACDWDRAIAEVPSQ